MPDFPKVSAHCAALKNVKIIPSAGKFMATIFWDFREFMLADYLQRRHSVYVEYYASILQGLSGILFHHGNAPLHKSAVAMKN